MTTYSRERYISHGDDIPMVGLKTAERVAEHVRFPSSPTPLNPFKLNREGVPYYIASLDTIDTILEIADETEMAQNAPDYIRQLMPASVRGALTLRFQESTFKVPNQHTPLELFDKAEMGCASPEELIGLLELDPEISSVELAKLSHPYEWGATENMDRAVTDAISQFEIDVNEDPDVRYILAGVDDVQNTRAVNIVRKMNLGVIDGVHGPLNVVKRDSYLVDLEADVDGFPEMRKECQRFINKIYRENPKSGGKPVRYNHGHNRLHGVIESGLNNKDAVDYLYPAVSSYYVHTIS